MYDVPSMYVPFTLAPAPSCAHTRASIGTVAYSEPEGMKSRHGKFRPRNYSMVRNVLTYKKNKANLTSLITKLSNAYVAGFMYRIQ